MARVIWKYRDLRFVVGIAILAVSMGSASAQQLAARADLQPRPDTAPKTSIKSGTKTAAAAPSSPLTASDAKPARRYEGTGLGLAIVKGLIERHGGKLTIESEPRVGSQISLIFPSNLVIAEGARLIAQAVT